MPADSAAIIASQSVQSPSAMVCSSNRTRPRVPPDRFIGVHGSVCFWPLSAIAQNHGPTFGRRSQASSHGLHALFP